MYIKPEKYMKKTVNLSEYQLLEIEIFSSQAVLHILSNDSHQLPHHVIKVNNTIMNIY